MIRTFTSILLLAGMALPGYSAGTQPQPDPQAKHRPEVYMLSSGDRSYLGIDIQDITSDRVAPLKLREERGVEITMVDQDAPAGKAGLHEHDVILEFNGTKVESEEQLRRLIRETPPGRTVTLGISRDGNPMQIPVQLADRGKLVGKVPKTFVMPEIEIPRIEIPSYSFQVQTYSPSLGIQTESLTRQLGEFFGVKDGEGVLVRSVEKGSAAEKAGLKAGDVIIRADNQKLSGRADLSQVLRNHRQGGKVTLGIMREKREQTVTVDLPERSKDSSWNWNSGDWRMFENFGDWDSEDWQTSFDNLSDIVENMRPEIEAAHNQGLLALKSATDQLRNERATLTNQARQMRSQAENALRESHRQLRDQQRLLRDLQRQMKPMI